MSQPLHNEKHLLQHIAAGDPHAFSQLFDHYFPKVYSYIDSLIKSPQTTEDLVMDIFLKLWTTREQLPLIENPGAFLRTIARNKAINHLKSLARQQTLLQDYQREMAIRSVILHEDRLLDAHLQEAFDKAIDILTPQRKKIFLMHRNEQLSYAEIAEQLNISVTTVKKTMAIAHQNIREFLQTNYRESLGTFLLFFVFY